MRILVITQYIYPEVFRSSDLVFELQKRGHKVDVLTGIPNYPEGKYYKEYGIFKNRFEKINGVKFFRCFQTPRKLLPSIWGLGLNYVSFVISASLWSLFYFSWYKYDAIITHEPSPITQILPAILLGKIKRIPVISWIMDIWPDSVTDSVDKKLQKILLPPLNYITEMIYRESDKLLITSKGFKKLINRHNDYSSKIIYFPNWGSEMKPIKDFSLPPLPKGFIIMVAGNLGESQDLESVAKVMLKTKDTDEIKWVFLGDGSKKIWLENFIIEHNLNEKAYILGKYPPETMPNFFERSNAMLVTLSSGYSFLDATVPARLQSYMGAGRPIFAMLGYGGQEIIKEANCGYAVNPGDVDGLVNAIRQALNDRTGFENKGKNGLRYFEKEFKFDRCIDNFEEIMRSTAKDF